MRKMIDFVYHIYPTSSDPERGFTSEALTQEIRAKYLSKGYEVFGCDVAQVTSVGVVMIIMTFAKYEEVSA